MPTSHAMPVPHAMPAPRACCGAAVSRSEVILGVHESGAVRVLLGLPANLKPEDKHTHAKIDEV